MHITWEILKSITLNLIQKTQQYYMKIITVFWEQPQAVDRVQNVHQTLHFFKSKKHL